MRTIRKLSVMAPVETYLNRRWPDLTSAGFAFLGAALPLVVAIGYIDIAEGVIDNPLLLRWFGGDVNCLCMSIMIPVILLFTASMSLFFAEILTAVSARYRKRAITWLGILFIVFQIVMLAMTVSVLNAIQQPVTPVLLATVVLIELICLGYLCWDEWTRFGGKRAVTS